MPRDGYLRFDPNVERQLPDEPEVIKAVLASLQGLSQAILATRNYAGRLQHAKGHGFLKGELQIYDDLPVHLRQGLFATARNYPAIIRLSTAFGDPRSDRIRVPRGLAIKVLGVDGPKALPDDTTANQDILLVNHKRYFSDASSYLKAQSAIALRPRIPDLALRSMGFLSRVVVSLTQGVGVNLPLQVLSLADAGNNILGETYYSMAAMRFGDYIAKLSLAPVSASLLELTGQPGYKDDDALLNSVVEFFSKNSAEYELRAQLCVNLDRTPIEDCSVEWPEELTPFQPLARLVLPRQQADSPARRDYSDGVLSFSPWRCLAAHQPLGSIMRLRQEVYNASAAYRHDVNKKPMTEPRDISEIPD